MRILIADDDRVTVQLLSSVLKAAGYEMSIAYDGMQALMMAVKNPPDALILDIGMPGGTGLHVLERLRASSKTSAVPVLVITALTDPDLPARTRALGASEFLAKPVVAERLRAALDRMLGNAKVEEKPA